MDEVQSLPCKLWQLLDAVLNGLSKEGNSQILLMSATLPPFVSETTPLLENYDEYFRSFSRYELHLHIGEKLDVQIFCEDLAARLGEWLRQKRKSAYYSEYQKMCPHSFRLFKGSLAGKI